MALAVAGCTEPSPAPPGAVQVMVDATAPQEELKRVWAYHGFDELNYVTEPPGRELLRTLAAAHSAPVYVRNHFWLNSGDGEPSLKWGSTNVYSEDPDGAPRFDWQLTDGLLDAVTEAGTLPLVELGFMPEALSTHPAPYRPSNPRLLNGGCFYPPKDYDKWAALIRSWAAHAKERFPDAGSRWWWELWNEPDGGYFHGSVEEYAHLWDVTEAALHDVLPDAKLAGPAVINPDGAFLARFLEHCERDGVRLDAVTFHAKGGVHVADGTVELDLGRQLRLHRAGFQAVAASTGLANTPILITEADPEGCAACLPDELPGAAYRLSPAYGAYELAMMKRSLELATELGVDLEGVLTWAFTFLDSPYFAGYRELASNGIHLPVLASFQLLGQLSGQRLPLDSSGARPLAEVIESGVRVEPDLDGMAALADGKIRVLIWNYHDRLEVAAATSVELSVRVPGEFGTSVHVSELRVDDSHGNAPSVWRSQGEPTSPTGEQLHELEQSMVPASVLDESRAVTRGAVSLHLDLPRFGISLVTIEPTDASR